jgi:hypothetical protein
MYAAFQIPIELTQTYKEMWMLVKTLLETNQNVTIPFMITCDL